MKKVILILISISLLISMSYAGSRLITLNQTLKSEQLAFSRLFAPETVAETDESEVQTVSASGSDKDVICGASDVQEEVERTIEKEKLEDLKKQNEDFAGWLRIKGTVIDYPVMLNTAEPDFYLSRDFSGKESISGTPYIGKGCDTESDNIIVYGHHMKNGTMFAQLLKYEDRDFWEKHKTVCFDTLQEYGEYEILAAFREKVHYTDEKNVFRYYDFTGELSEDEYKEYVEKIKEISIYDTGLNAVYGQQLLTLSTCAYHMENGRFVVVAVKKE